MRVATEEFFVLCSLVVAWVLVLVLTFSSCFHRWYLGAQEGQNFEGASCPLAEPPLLVGLCSAGLISLLNKNVNVFQIYLLQCGSVQCTHTIRIFPQAKLVNKHFTQAFEVICQLTRYINYLLSYLLRLHLAFCCLYWCLYNIRWC